MESKYQPLPNNQNLISSDNKYDAIVIGAGIGGLTCGAFLAKADRKVLVLEQHSKIGGYTHRFRRGNYTFESGVHSAPMAKNGTIRNLLKLLGINDCIEPVALPEMYHIETPDFRFTMPMNKDDLRLLIAKKYPHQNKEFILFEKQLESFRNNIIYPLNDFENIYYKENISFLSQFHNLSYHDLISRYFSDINLRNAFLSQWPYGGLSSRQGASLFHTMMFLLHYDDGSYTLRGGFSTLADALAQAITSRGGCIKTSSTVSGLRTEGDNVVACTTTDHEEYYASTFISNISPYQIHYEILDKNGQNRRWHRRLSNLNPSISSMIVYLGMKQGSIDRMDYSTYFWADSPDNDLIFNNIWTNNKKHLDHLIVLRNIINPKFPTLTLMNFTLKSFSNNWKSDKMKLAEMMIDKAESLFPNIKKDIVLFEVGSPATFERYTANTNGAIYGFENIKTLYGEAKMPISTHLNNLYQVGHWGRPGCGIWNVMVNGYTASHQILIKQEILVH